MHELSLCENIREILEEQAVHQNFTRVERVCLEVGALSCVEPDALRFGFDVAMRGSVAEGAKLEIVETEAMGWCHICNEAMPMQTRFDICEKCKSPALEMQRGQDIRIKEVEVV